MNKLIFLVVCSTFIILLVFSLKLNLVFCTKININIQNDTYFETENNTKMIIFFW